MMRPALLLSLCLMFQSLRVSVASDHTDPIDPLNRQRQEGAITDLYVFPVLKDGTSAVPFERTANLPLHDPLADVIREELSDEDRNQIDAIMVILCVRRELTDIGSLKLEPYTYKVNVDYNSAVNFPRQADLNANSNNRAPMVESTDAKSGHSHGMDKLSVVEAFARYGGKIRHPDEIKEDIVIEFRLTNDGKLQAGYPRFAVPKGLEVDLSPISGIYDDPFIFPSFFGTNIVAMQARIPLNVFPADRSDLLIWATSHKRSRQLDHVGRSLRTQNPRFELLNTLHPSKHVAAITEEHVHPSLMRDIKLRLNFGSLFAYRHWDFVPDVMCYSTKLPVGFPNGRLLTDDVAAILAQHGDTLLYELSFQDDKYRWPRQTTNDGRTDEFRGFKTKSPFLQVPHPKRAQPPPLRLSTASIVKLTAIALFLLLSLLLTHWLFARWYYRRKLRQRYL